MRGESAADELDLGAVGRALLAKKMWVIGPTLLVAALAFAAVNGITPRYKSEARILIDGRENVFLRPEAEKLPEPERAVDPEGARAGGGRRRGGGYQPGPARARARSRPQGDQGLEARRAQRIRSRAQRRLAHPPGAGARRADPRPAQDERGRAGAGSLLRPPH